MLLALILNITINKSKYIIMTDVQYLILTRSTNEF